MKHKIFISLNIIVIGMFSSCADYLESDKFFKDRLSIEESFRTKPYAEKWLAQAFTDLTGINADVASKGNTPHCFADDMYYGDRDVEYDTKESGSMSYNQFRLGEYTENDRQGVWEKSYRGIRNATICIHNIKYNEEMTESEIADYRGQARFVRAYYYWLLLRKYGPIPLLPEEGIDYTDSYDDIATPRSSYEECAEYISKEMVLAAKEMKPGRREDALSSARATQGAALATRAKALLYAASPLMNGNTDNFARQLVDDKGRQLLNSDYDEGKWAKAAAAARDVMELGVYELNISYSRSSGDEAFPATITPPADGNFSENNWPNGWKDIDPFESYRSTFNGELQASGNKEIIFTRGNNGGEQIRAMVIHQLPRHVTGWNTHGLTQKQVDAYYMNDGSDAPGKDKEINRGDGSDRVSGYVTQADFITGRYKPLRANVSLQYANREPRFYASVAYNGSVWHLLRETLPANFNQQVFYYRQEKNGNGYANTMFWLRTGIGVKKFVHPDDTREGGDDGKVKMKAEPAIRYADILLIYAEALNELTGSYTIPSWDGSKSYTISRDIDEMKKGIHPVRIRAGVPDYSSAIYADADELRKTIKRERQIELVCEGQRYYDLRRWKDASVEESLPIYGCNVLITEQERDLFHKPVISWALKTTFAPKMYFWPISHSELKRNKRLTQNPGWTYND